MKKNKHWKIERKKTLPYRGEKENKNEFFYWNSFRWVKTENDPKQKAINKKEIAAKNLFEEEAKMKKKKSCKSYFLFITVLFSIADFAVLLTEKPISRLAGEFSTSQHSRRMNKFNSRMRIVKGIHWSRRWVRNLFSSLSFSFVALFTGAAAAASIPDPISIPLTLAFDFCLFLEDVKQKVNKNCRVLLFGWQ